MRWWLIIWGLSLGTVVNLRADAPRAEYFLGAAKLDISPREPVLLSGYAGRDHQLTRQVAQPLYARAIAIGQDRQTTTVEAAEAAHGSGPVLLIAVDNCAVHAAIRRVVCREIWERWGVAPESITVTSTHTHSGPMLAGALSNLLIRDLTAEEHLACDRYTQQLIEQLIEVGEAALQQRQWVTLERNVGHLDFAINRRGGGVVDHELPLLVAYDRNRQPVMALTNYACHCVAAGSGLEICGDWAGFAAEAIDATNLGLVSVVLIGCGADQNPARMGGLAAAQQQGQQLADEVQALLAAPKQTVRGPLHTQFAEIELPLERLPSAAEWQAKSQQGGIVGYHANKNLQRLAAGERLPTTVTYPIQTWTFGQDLALAFLGGEVVVDYVHLLRQRLDPARLWVTAYANDVACYIPSHRILQEGGYEGGDAMVWYDLPTRLAHGVEDLIMTEVERQLGGDFAATHEPTHDPTRTGGTWPKSPLDALNSLQTHESLTVELVAAEPLIEDPVAIDFGPDGALWVAQMVDYPEGLDGQYQAGGSIRTLRDTTGDGQFDSAVTFLSELPFPTDVKVWRDGVLICAAPHVLFARDTTGDGRADEVITVLTGFETHNYQARVNSLTWGLDGWVYGAAGIFGGLVRDAAGTETNLSNRDFRFAPDQGWVQAVSGRTQQGRARDDWGNWFGCDNGTLLYHYPATEHYSQRHAVGPTPPPAVSVAQSSRLFPAANTIQWALSGPPGVPTSACGMTILRSSLLGSEFHQAAFTCEPVNQLVHRLQLVPQGTTFTGVRGDGETDREFLWSTDNWFRPVQVKTGLDGALYVVDMYRYLIEHPRFLPEDVRAGVDVRAGQGRGRIYRVVPRQGLVPRPVLTENLHSLSSAELARRMDTDNGAFRDLLHQVLWWRSAEARGGTPDWEQGVAVLRELASQSPSAAVRIQTLAVLDQGDALDRPAVLRAMQDEDSRVRRQAIRLAERWFPLAETGGAPGLPSALRGDGAADDQAVLGARIAALAHDDDPPVRLQAAYTLGYWDDDASAEALSDLLDRDGDDPWISAAVFSSLHRRHVATVLRQRLAKLGPADSFSGQLPQLTSQALQLGRESALQDLLSHLMVPADRDSLSIWQLQLWAEMTAAVHGTPNAWGPAGQELAEQTARLLPMLGRQFTAGEREVEWKRQALRVMGLAGTAEQVLPSVRDGLQPQQVAAVQEAALESLGRLAGGGDPAATAAFFEVFHQLTPLLQARALQIAQTYPHLTRQLIAEIRTGNQPLSLLPAAARQFLLDHPDPAVRQAATELLVVGARGHWAEQFPEYRDLDLKSGSAERGEIVFRQHCAACHRLNDVGHAIGPDLQALTDKSAPAFLQAILDPNADMDARYAAYTVLTVDGQIFHGLLQSESAGTVTLAGQDGRHWQLQRSEVDEIRRTGKSLMPEGWERDISPPAMLDLLVYLGASAATTRYRYGDGSGPHANYPDSNPPHKLVDGRFGTGRFDDGQWVSYYHVGRPSQQVEFDLGAEQALSQIRVTYGVNHVPGVIHAPQLMQIRLKLADGREVLSHSVDHWDDAPDGLGIYQIARRQKRVTFPATAARFVELSWESSFEWTSLAEVEFNPVSDDLAPSDLTRPLPAETSPGDSTARLQALISTVDEGTADEYRVIPAVWREALEAGKRDDATELQALLTASLPRAAEPLRDWQAVVIGGGIINGLSQVGHYPGERIREILANDPELWGRWERSLFLATDMVDHEPTPHGTRYDALRMVALRPWPAAQGPLQRYLEPGRNHELQQGAVSGLVDVPEPAIIGLLDAALEYLPNDLQELAIDGIVRPNAQDRLNQALESGSLSREAMHPLLRKRLALQ